MISKPSYTMLKAYSALFVTTVLCFHGASSREPKIAIVGGGIGGTSAAYFLRELLGSVEIDLYESNKIGGRLATVTINNEEYEAGGGIIHLKNKYMLDFLKLSGKQKHKNVFLKFGLYNGTEFMFTNSEWQLVTLARLVWRYGYGPIKLQNYIQHMQKSFSRIYALQANMQCFATVGEMLRAMNPRFVTDMGVSTKKGFMKEGFSEKLVDELVMATLTANYGQSTDVHKFVGIISMAGADGEWWAVEGGNKGIPEYLLETSKVNLINAKVTKVSFSPATEDYNIEFMNNGDSESSVNNARYNIVIMATPLTADVSDIEFDLPTNVTFPGHFHRTVCTVVEGTANYTYFGFDNESEMIDMIFTVNFDNFYTTVGRINAVNIRKSTSKKSNVWKLFSQVLIEERDLKSVFSEIKSMHVVDWLAYPHYQSEYRDDSFILHKNLFHVNAIEWAASAMEMSVIGAKNVALLVFKTLYGIDF